MAQNEVNIYSNSNTLDTITKEYLSKRTIDFQYPKNDFYDLLRAKANIVNLNTESDYEAFVVDSYNFSTAPGGRNVVLPDGANKVDAAKIALGITQYFANAEIGEWDIKFENQDAGTYVKVVDRALNDMLNGVKWYNSVLAFGNGTGQIAKIGTTASSAVTVGNTGTAVCNNTYLDLGIDNVKFFRVGLTVDFYRTSDGTTSKVGTGFVTKVNYKYGRNSDNTQTGSFVFKNIGSESYKPTANDMVFIHGIYGSSEIPQGLRKIINPAIDNMFGVASNGIFQGLYRGKKGATTTIARNSTTEPAAELFRSKMWRTKSDGTLGLLDTTNYETYTGATLGDWDLGTLREVLSDVDYNSKNSGRVDTLLMNQFMADMIFKLGKDQVDIQQTVTETDNTAKLGRDILRATAFRKADGDIVNIQVSDWMQDNEIIGLCSDDLFILDSGAAKFLGRSNGGIWEPTYANGRNNFQAPYEGFVNAGAYRTDKCFVIQGLKDIRN